MRVIPNFTIGQTVWYCLFEELRKEKVKSIEFEGSIDENGNAYINTQYLLESNTQLGEESIFASKEDLINFLLEQDGDFSDD